VCVCVCVFVSAGGSRQSLARLHPAENTPPSNSSSSIIVPGRRSWCMLLIGRTAENYTSWTRIQMPFTFDLYWSNKRQKWTVTKESSLSIAINCSVTECGGLLGTVASKLKKEVCLAVCLPAG